MSQFPRPSTPYRPTGHAAVDAANLAARYNLDNAAALAQILERLSMAGARRTLHTKRQSRRQRLKLARLFDSLVLYWHGNPRDEQRGDAIGFVTEAFMGRYDISAPRLEMMLDRALARAGL